MIPTRITVDIKADHPLQRVHRALVEQFPDYDYTFKTPPRDALYPYGTTYGIWSLIIDYEGDEELPEGAHNTDLHVEWRTDKGFRVSWVNREWDFSDEDPDVELPGDWDHYDTATETLKHIIPFLAA